MKIKGERKDKEEEILFQTKEVKRLKAKKKSLDSSLIHEDMQASCFRYVRNISGNKLACAYVYACVVRMRISVSLECKGLLYT